MNETYRHPNDMREIVFGRILQLEDVVEKTDVFNSTKGKWEPVPSNHVGSTVAAIKRSFPEVVLIRPAA
jgi:hypothetical protein